MRQSRYRAEPLSRSPQCRGRRDGELLAGDENQGPEKTQPPHGGGLRESSLPTKRLRRIRPRRTRGRASSFVSSSDEERKSAGRARVLQRRGRARVRQLEKMVESMPEEAKRLGAVETKSVTRKTLELHATSVREFCDWSRLVGRQQCGGFGSGQTSHGVHELAFFRGPPGVERRETVGQRPLFLPNFFADGGKSTGSRLPSQRMEKGVSEFFETTAPGSQERFGRGHVQDRWYAGGCHVQSLSPTRANAVTQNPRISWHQRMWSPKLGDTVVPSGRHREQQNWRSRRYDQSRLNTMFVDGASVRKASTTTATRQSFPQPELRRILVAAPPSRRESAGGHGDISRTPLWSFGGQSRKPANVGIHTGTADDGNQPSLYAATRKADVSTKVGQSSLHWSRHNASTATTSCPQYCFIVTPLRHRLDCSVFL